MAKRVRNELCTCGATTWGPTTWGPLVSGGESSVAIINSI